MCFGGTNTVTQNSGPPPQVLQNYQNLVGQATGTAAGLTGLSGPPVAGWNNELSSALANINQAGDAVNYFNSGLGALNTGMGTVGGALNYLPSEISGIGAAQGMIPGAQGLVGAGASTMSGALPYYGAAGSTISGALPMYGAAAGTEMSALPYYNQGASTLGGALSSYGAGLGTLGSATPYFGAGAGLVGQSTVNPFTSGSISQYMSPYINNVVNSTANEFNNQNAIQANNLTSSAIMGGNAFGGDRAGVAQGVLAGQQQTAEAPVLAGLYNSGYQTAGQQAMQEQGLMQSAGNLMGSLGSGLGNIGAEYGSLGAGMTGAAQAYGSLGSGIAGVGQGLGSLASGEVGAGSALGSVGAGIAGVGSGLGGLGSITGGLAGEAGSLAGMYGSAAGVQGGLGATQAGIGSQISALGPAWASTLESLGGSQLTGGSAIQNWEQQNLSSGYQGLLNQLGVTGTQFLAPIVEGTGSLSGGTGTTTSPGPSAVSQLGGLGLSGLALNQLTGGGLTSALGSLGSALGGGAASLGATSAADYAAAGLGSLGADAGAAAAGLALVKHGGRIGYDDGGSVDDSSDNNNPSGLGGIVGYNALARELGTGAAANQLAAGLEEGVGFADGGTPNLPTGQPLNMSALLQGSGAGIPGQYGMTFQRGPGPPGLHMGMGPPQPPRAGAPDNGLNNLLAQVQQVTRYMRPNQNQSSDRNGGRIAFGGAVNLPGHYDAGGDVPEDATLPSNATPDVSGDIAPVNQDNWDRWLHGQSYLESPNGAPSQSSSAKGYFQFIDGTAKRATDAGLPNPQQGSYDSQADATKQYIQHFHPSAADAINAGDFGAATKLLNKEWPSLPGGSQMQNPSQYGAWQRILGGDTQPGLAALPAASTPTQGTLPSSPAPSSAIGKPDPWQAVLAAGLGMMAGQSPHALSNIGQGGLMGLQNYQQQKVELREEASQQLAAQRLSQEAKLQAAQIAHENVQTETAQNTLAATRALQGQTGPAGATPKSGLSAALPNGQPDPQAALRNAAAAASKIRSIQQTPQGPVAVDADGQPVMNPNDLLSTGMSFIRSGVPGYQSAGEKMLGLYETILNKGQSTNAQGTVIPLPGSAETEARAAGMKAAATAPYDIAKNAVYRAGQPVAVSPNQVVTTGAQVNPTLGGIEDWAVKNLGTSPGSSSAKPGAGAQNTLPLGQSPFTPQLIHNPDGSVTSSVTPATEAIQKDAANRYEKAGDSYIAAQDIKMRLGIMQQDAAQLDNSKWSTTGTGADARVGLAKAINSISTTLGGKPLFDPGTVGSWESLNKQTRQMGFELARTLGSREAMMIVQQATSSVPNAENTPVGFRLVSNAIQQQVQRQADYYEFATDYLKSHGGDTVGAEIAFNKQNPPSIYSQRAIANSVVDLRDKAVLLAHGSDPAAIAKFNRLYPQVPNAAGVLLNEPQQ